MIDYAKFLKDNGLKQRDIVNMLGVSKPFVSQIVHGLANMSSEKLDELIKKSNLLGYDVSMLTNTPSINASATNNSSASVIINESNAHKDAEIAILKARVNDLERMLEDEKARSAQYWELIQKLTK